jgi:hypothetical protein
MFLSGRRMNAKNIPKMNGDSAVSTADNAFTIISKCEMIT